MQSPEKKTITVVLTNGTHHFFSSNGTGEIFWSTDDPNFLEKNGRILQLIKGKKGSILSFVFKEEPGVRTFYIKTVSKIDSIETS